VDFNSVLCSFLHFCSYISSFPSSIFLGFFLNIFDNLFISSAPYLSFSFRSPFVYFLSFFLSYIYFFLFLFLYIFFFSSLFDHLVLFSFVISHCSLFHYFSFLLYFTFHFNSSSFDVLYAIFTVSPSYFFLSPIKIYIYIYMNILSIISCLLFILRFHFMLRVN
jgi:hypothetical protein